MAGQLDSWGQPIGHAGANRFDRSNDPADIKQMNIWGKEFAALHNPTTSPPDPGSSVLQGQFNTVRDGLKDGAGIGTTHDGNLEEVRAGGNGLNGANVDPVRNDVEGWINDVGDGIAQGEERIVNGTEQQRNEIRKEANREVSGSVVEAVIGEDNYETVSGWFGNENQSSGDSPSDIEDSLSKVQQDIQILQGDINRSANPPASGDQQQIEKNLGRGGSSRTAQARRQKG